MNLILGVTGHRDIRKKDIRSLKRSVKRIFKKYKSIYPDKNLILLSPLAEGADILVAEAAKEMGIKLWVVIPFKQRCYLKTFDDKKNINKYKKLKNYSSKFITLNCCIKGGYTKCYKHLGEKVVDLSDILIALWDCKESDKIGGTAQIVKYIKGIKKSFYIIKTPRLSNPKIKNPYKILYKEV